MKTNENSNDSKKKPFDNSSQDSFEQKYEKPKKQSSHSTQISQFFVEYSEFLQGVLQKDYLSKYKQQFKASKISFNQRCFQSEMSLIILKHTENCEAVTFFVSFSHFSFQISAVNLQQESLSQIHLQILGKGSYGKIYQFKIIDSNVAIKSIEYLNELSNTEKPKINQKGRNDTISKAIYQYCLYKLFSVLEIGPKMINIFGFDLLICKNKIEFSMQKCSGGHQNHKSLELLFTSLNLMHSLGIIHGDIKQDNIMWSSSFQKWVLIDFGFSQVLKQKPGEKTLTNYFGSYKNCSNEMKNLFHSSKSEYIDLYYNDLFGMKMVIDGLFSKIIEGPLFKLKYKKMTSRPYQNFIKNCQLCYFFYTCNHDGFIAFLLQLNQNFILLEQFWRVIKNVNKTKKTFLMLKKLFEVISDPENMIGKYLASFTEQRHEQQKGMDKINFQSRIKQRVDEFNGAIDDIMLFSLIYFNFDISPHRFVEKQTLLKALMTKFEPLNLECWKDLIKLLKNPYVSLEQVRCVFEKIKLIMEIKVWVETEVKQYQLFVKGRQIAKTCLQKYGYNLFQLNQGCHLYGSNLQTDIENSARIFQYEKFSDLIELNSNQFPYLQFLDGLRKGLVGEQLIQDCLTNIQRIQKKYKIQDQPMAIKVLKNQLNIEFSLNFKRQDQKIISPFKNLQIFSFIINSRNYILESHRPNSLREIENIENFQKLFLSKSFFDIFNLEKNVRIFFKERYKTLRQTISENNLKEFTRNFIGTFESFTTSSELRYFDLLDNLHHFSYIFRHQFSKFQETTIRAILIQIANHILENRITSPKLFTRLCQTLGNIEIQSLKSKSENIKNLFQFFEQKQMLTKTKSRFLYYKLKLYRTLSLFNIDQYKKAINKTVNFILELKQQKQKYWLFESIETIQIFQRYFKHTDQCKLEKQAKLQQFLRFALQQKSFGMFPTFMEIIVQFYSGEQFSEFQKCIQMMIKLTNFTIKQKGLSFEMLKFVTADYGLEIIVQIEKNKNRNNLKNHVFSFISKRINSEKENFYIENGNVIILIEKVFKLFFNKFLVFSVQEIIWLLKVSSHLIKYSNAAFSRSFCAAMNYWFPQLAIQCGFKLNERKSKMIMNRQMRNSQFMKEPLKTLRTRKQICSVFNQKVLQKFKKTLEHLQNIKQLSIRQSFRYSEDKTLLYLQHLKQRSTPNDKILYDKNEIWTNAVGQGI